MPVSGHDLPVSTRRRQSRYITVLMVTECEAAFLTDKVFRQLLQILLKSNSLSDRNALKIVAIMINVHCHTLHVCGIICFLRNYFFWCRKG